MKVRNGREFPAETKCNKRVIGARSVNQQAIQFILIELIQRTILISFDDETELKSLYSTSLLLLKS